MYVRCWGSRGSLAVSGRQFDRYGGDTACMEIRSNQGDVVVVDAGTGIRGLGNKLVNEEVKSLHLLFTHAHWDHIMGFPFFQPLFVKGIDITIRGCPFDRPSFKSILKGFLSAPYFPVGLEVLRANIAFGTISTRPFSIGSLRITPIYLSHPNHGLGFRFEERGKSFVFLTDNELRYTHNGGLRFDDYAGFCRNADLLIHDAEYTRQDYRHSRHFGHSQYTDATQLAIAAGVKRFGMFHLNRERTDDQVDAIVRDARKILAKSKLEIDCFAVSNTFAAKI